MPTKTTTTTAPATKKTPRAEQDSPKDRRKRNFYLRFHLCLVHLCVHFSLRAFHNLHELKRDNQICWSARLQREFKICRISFVGLFFPPGRSVGRPSIPSSIYARIYDVHLLVGRSTDNARSERRVQFVEARACLLVIRSRHIEASNHRCCCGDCSLSFHCCRRCRWLLLAADTWSANCLWQA